MPNSRGWKNRLQPLHTFPPPFPFTSSELEITAKPTPLCIYAMPADGNQHPPPLFSSAREMRRQRPAAFTSSHAHRNFYSHLRGPFAPAKQHMLNLQPSPVVTSYSMSRICLAPSSLSRSLYTSSSSLPPFGHALGCLPAMTPRSPREQEDCRLGLGIPSRAREMRYICNVAIAL